MDNDILSPQERDSSEKKKSLLVHNLKDTINIFKKANLEFDNILAGNRPIKKKKNSLEPHLEHTPSYEAMIKAVNN